MQLSSRSFRIAGVSRQDDISSKLHDDASLSDQRINSNDLGSIPRNAGICARRTRFDLCLNGISMSSYI
jgi:hypothetical protein